MVWLILSVLLATLATLLVGILRRPPRLREDSYSRRLDVENLNTGVAWVGLDEKLRTVNPALAQILEVGTPDLIGHDWCDLFLPSDRQRVRQAYTQMLLAGRAPVRARGVRYGGAHAWFDVLLLAVHDRKMRFIGHHCLVEDRTHEHELEERIDQLTHAVSSRSDAAISR